MQIYITNDMNRDFCCSYDKSAGNIGQTKNVKLMVFTVDNSTFLPKAIKKKERFQTKSYRLAFRHSAMKIITAISKERPWRSEADHSVVYYFVLTVKKSLLYNIIITTHTLTL